MILALQNRSRGSPNTQGKIHWKKNLQKNAKKMFFFAFFFLGVQFFFWDRRGRVTADFEGLF